MKTNLNPNDKPSAPIGFAPSPGSADIVNGLKHTADDHPCCRDTLHMAASRIEELEIAVWISVKDRLPEGEEVICWDGEIVTTMFPCTGSRFEDQPKQRCADFGITHWMPMPNPPNMQLTESDSMPTVTNELPSED